MKGEHAWQINKSRIECDLLQVQDRHFIYNKINSNIE